MDNQYGLAAAFPLSAGHPGCWRSIRRTTEVGCHAPAVGTACLQMTLAASACLLHSGVRLPPLLLAISDERASTIATHRN